MTLLSCLTVAELADGICLRAGRIAAAQAELLGWIAEFDRREGWAGPGMLSCAHGLSWRVGLSPGAACEQVRVARRLPELPAVEVAFADGRLSYSRVRAITRVAEPGDGVDWVALGRSTSAAQVEKVVRGMRRAASVGEAEADPERAAWKVRTRKRYDRDGNLVITIITRAEYAPVVEAGLEARRAELQRALDVQAASEPAGGPPVAGVPAGTPDRPAPAVPVEEAVVSGRPAGAAVVPFLADLPAGTPDGPASAAVVDEAPGAGLAGRDDRRAGAGGDGGVRRAVGESAGRAGCGHRADARAACDDGDRVPAGVPAGTPPRVGLGEALLSLAQDALLAEHAAHPEVARRRRPQLTAQVDPLSGWARQRDGELLPPSSLREVLRTLPGHGGPVRLRPVVDADLRRFDLGRRSRVVGPALRELLGVLDGERYRFPGCTRHERLHAHHVQIWGQGGPTDLDNLVLVCSRHHTLVHAQGFELVLHPDRRLTVSTADGVPLLHHPAQPWGDPSELATGNDVSAGTLPPDGAGARMDLGDVVAVLLAQAA